MKRILYLVFVLPLLITMIMHSSMSMNVKSLMAEMNLRDVEARKLSAVAGSNSEHPGVNSDVNNHHFIPRQDYGKYGGGTPSGGPDDNSDKSQEKN